MLLLTGSTTETNTGDPLAIIPWATLKAHLKQNTDDDQVVINAYMLAAVSFCEQYLNRCLVAKTVKMYYQPVDTTVATLQLRYHFNDQAITVTVITADGTDATVTHTKIAPDAVYISDLPTGWQLITVEYTPSIYEDIPGIIPAILMKVGEMYNNREDGPISKTSSIISILNRHRIKRHA